MALQLARRLDRFGAETVWQEASRKIHSTQYLSKHPAITSREADVLCCIDAVYASRKGSWSGEPGTRLS